MSDLVKIGTKLPKGTLCRCGCGQEAGLARSTGRNGRKRGEQLEYVSGHNHRSQAVGVVMAQLPTAQCVNWPGRMHPSGYGAISSKVTPLAHRYVYIQLHGVPELPELDHLCRNTACVNPAHLEPVTTAENARRRVAATPRCPNDHPYDDVYLYKGRRYCRACRRASDRQRPSGGARRRLAMVGAAA